MSDRQQIEPLLIDATGAAALLGIGRSFFYENLATERIPLKPIRFGRKVLFSVQELRRFVESGCPPAGKWQKVRDTR